MLAKTHSKIRRVHMYNLNTWTKKILTIQIFGVPLFEDFFSKGLTIKFNIFGALKVYN